MIKEWHVLKHGLVWSDLVGLILLVWSGLVWSGLIWSGLVSMDFSLV